jgi:AraC-like DNA-binding protein
MKTHSISLCSLPSIAFAHEYSSDNYDITFPKQENFIEISYNLCGAVTVKQDDGEDIVPEGALSVHIRSTDGIRCYCEGKQQHITVGFAINFTEGADLCLPHYISPPASEKFVKRLRRIVNEFTLCRTTTVKLASDVLYLLAEISAEYAKISTEKESYGHFLYAEKAKRYIATHIDRKLYVAEIAENVGLSVGYLSNLFRRATGQTLVEFINRTKLARVKELTERGLTVKEAGILSGYDDENYVSRIYKKYFGKNITDDER